MARVLIVVAHPDDEVIGVGGTIARHTSCRDEVFILILGEGIISRDPEPGGDKQALAQLHQVSIQAADLLGAKLLSIIGLPDNRMDSVDLLDVVKHVEKVIEKVKPQMVYTHHIGDLNIDHQITSRAVITACRPLPTSPVRKLYTFPTLSSTEWMPSGTGIIFQGERYVDISDYLDIKLRALQMYDGELRPFPHPRSLQAVRAQAEIFGAIAGLSLAETFKVIWDIEK